MSTLFEQPNDWQPPVRESVPTIAWADASQLGMLKTLAGMAGLRVLGAGGPWRSRGSGQPEPAPGSIPGDPLDDLPGAVIEREARLVLALSATGLDADRPAPCDDEQLRAAATRSGAIILSLAPVTRPMPAERPMRQAGAAMQIPLFLRSPMMGDLREVLGEAGGIRSLVAHFRGLPEHGPASARCFDALALAHALLGEPEQVDAAAIPLPGVAGVRVPPGQSFDELRGDVLCTLRYSGGHAASIAATDHGGRWSRGFTITTERLVIRATDRGFEVLDHDGRLVERGGASANAGGGAMPGDAASVIAASIVRMTDPRATDQEVFDAEAILATCHAAALSARTGQGESPATMRHVRGL